jgi:hypothetical protein
LEGNASNWGIAHYQGKGYGQLIILPHATVHVPHLFKSNTVATESDPKLIRGAISNAKYFIARLDQDLLPQKLNLTKKEKLQLKHQDFIQSHKALLSSIRQLPVELLETIFMNVYHLWGSSVDQLTAIRDFPGVPSLERNSTLSACFVGQPAVYSPWGEADTKEVLYFFPFRSALTFWSIADTEVTYLRPSQEIPFHPAIDLIVQHSHRLKCLSINSEYTTMNAFAQMRGKLPHLEPQLLELRESLDRTSGRV